MGRGERRLEIVSWDVVIAIGERKYNSPVPSVGISLLAGALCTLLSEAWLRGSILVRKVGWEDQGVCGQWSQKQGNAYKNTEKSGSGYEEEDGEREEEEVGGVLQQWQGRQTDKTIGWMLQRLGDVNRL
jgi:hypothetical protein